MNPVLYPVLFYNFDLRATHARELLLEALASVSFEFVFARVRVQNKKNLGLLYAALLFFSTC